MACAGPGRGPFILLVSGIAASRQLPKRQLQAAFSLPADACRRAAARCVCATSLGTCDRLFGRPPARLALASCQVAGASCGASVAVAIAAAVPRRLRTIAGRVAHAAAPRVGRPSARVGRCAACQRSLAGRRPRRRVAASSRCRCATTVVALGGVAAGGLFLHTRITAVLAVCGDPRVAPHPASARLRCCLLQHYRRGVCCCAGGLAPTCACSASAARRPAAGTAGPVAGVRAAAAAGARLLCGEHGLLRADGLLCSGHAPAVGYRGLHHALFQRLRVTRKRKGTTVSCALDGLHNELSHAATTRCQGCGPSSM